MPVKLLRKILLVLIALVVLSEAICWIFVRFPAEPLRTLDLTNDIPGFKKNVRMLLGDDQVRYLNWEPGKDTEGKVRIFCTGGLATLGMLQASEDTWWGRLHGLLKEKGIETAVAARGFDHTGMLQVVKAVTPIVERLKPHVIILNAGFDDVVVHPATYAYDKDKLSKLPAQSEPSGLKEFFINYSQLARIRRMMNRSSEANQLQNTLGRTDVYKRHFEERRKALANLPRAESIPRAAGLNDPLPEYMDALTAFRDLAAKHGATLIITGEAALHDSSINLTEEGQLLAYIPLREPDAAGNVQAARPDPAWVRREMERFAFQAEQFATENKLTWFDLNEKVPRTVDNFFTDVMLTDAGAATAAKLLLPVVEPVLKGKAK